MVWTLERERSITLATGLRCLRVSVEFFFSAEVGCGCASGADFFCGFPTRLRIAVGEDEDEVRASLEWKLQTRACISALFRSRSYRKKNGRIDHVFHWTKIRWSAGEL